MSRAQSKQAKATLEDWFLTRHRNISLSKSGDELKYCQCIFDLIEGVQNLPQGLLEAWISFTPVDIYNSPDLSPHRYRLILSRMNSELHNYRNEQTIQILEWISCSYRSLKIYEVQDGIHFQ